MRRLGPRYRARRCCTGRRGRPIRSGADGAPREVGPLARPGHSSACRVTATGPRGDAHLDVVAVPAVLSEDYVTPAARLRLGETALPQHGDCLHLTVIEPDASWHPALRHLHRQCRRGEAEGCAGRDFARHHPDRVVGPGRGVEIDHWRSSGCAARASLARRLRVGLRDRYSASARFTFCLGPCARYPARPAPGQRQRQQIAPVAWRCPPGPASRTAA
jgi:hypothetical protein